MSENHDEKILYRFEHVFIQVIILTDMPTRNTWNGFSLESIIKPSLVVVFDEVSVRKNRQN